MSISSKLYIEVSQEAPGEKLDVEVLSEEGDLGLNVAELYAAGMIFTAYKFADLRDMTAPTVAGLLLRAAREEIKDHFTEVIDVDFEINETREY